MQMDVHEYFEKVENMYTCSVLDQVMVDFRGACTG